MTTLIIRPNGVGDYTNLVPNDTVNWQMVNDVIPDEGATKVYTSNSRERKDAYTLQDTAESGTINSVKVYFRCYKAAGDTGYARPSLRLGGVETNGTQITVTTSWVTRSEILAKPGGGAWSWTDINNLQVVIGLWVSGFTESQCTQVYVEVDYTPVVAAGRSLGFIIG